MTTAVSKVQEAATFSIEIAEPDDFEAWRERARALVQCGISPERVVWSEAGGEGDLFAQAAGAPLPEPAADARPVRATKPFVRLAQSAICHSDPDRFALLYRLLWRLQQTPKALEDRADPDVRKLDELDRTVRRDMHKMRAFVRFRLIEQVEDGEPCDHYVAWFEPGHHILRRNAGFFVRRFANMRWSILTPRGCLHWDGETLVEGPPAKRSDAPAGDPVEDLWRTYYASIFNPARLKTGAMLKEMPKRYWKNLPEAALIPDLIAGAQAREAQMVENGAMLEEPRPDSLEALAHALHQCTRCPIGTLDNQAVAGEGLTRADAQFSGLMIVGEQPGDQEDMAGRPFVGPAGQLLDEYLQGAGIERSRAWVTNAVKHFKFTPRGKRRIHQSPTAKEIDVCRWWFEAERDLVQPKLVLALGASAARGMLGKTVSIAKARGMPHQLADGRELWITAHPSYLLRLDGEAREKQAQLFRADLAAVKERLDELSA